MSNICWFQPLKCEDLLIFLITMTENEEFLGSGQLVGQNKQSEGDTLGSGLVWSALLTYSIRDEMINGGKNLQIDGGWK